jgi:hypothetical protein
MKIKFHVNAELSIDLAERLVKTTRQFLTPRRQALLARWASAGLVAMASHWALNDPGPSKLLAEELIKILLRTQ